MHFTLTCVIIVQVKESAMKILVNSLLQCGDDKVVTSQKGILKDNLIKYYDEKIKVEINLNDFNLKRIGNDYELFLSFKEKRGYYYLKDINQMIEFKVTTEKLEVNDNCLKVIYKLDISDEIYNFEIDYEVI